MPESSPSGGSNHLGRFIFFVVWVGVFRFSDRNWSRFWRSTRWGRLFVLTQDLKVSREGKILSKQIFIFSYFEARYTWWVKTRIFPAPAVEILARNWHDECRKTPRIRMNWTSAQSDFFSFREKICGPRYFTSKLRKKTETFHLVPGILFRHLFFHHGFERAPVIYKTHFFFSARSFSLSTRCYWISSWPHFFYAESPQG